LSGEILVDPLSHIEHRLNALVDELRSAYSHYSVLQAIHDAVNRGSRAQQRFMLYFGVTLSAHSEAMFSCLFRLVDKRKDAIGIESFLRFVDRHAKVLPYGSTALINRTYAVE